MPPAAEMSAAVKPTGASLKVNVTCELAVAVGERAIDDVDRNRRVEPVDRHGVGAGRAGIAGRVGVAASATATEPVPEKPSLAVKVAV